jgi:hypothetical protein
MSTATRTRAPRQPRTVRLAVPPSPDNPFAIIVITARGKSNDYCVKPLPSDFGRAFQVEKIFDPEEVTYHVNLNGERSTCECKGHLRWGTVCKHIGALQTLVAKGKL